MGNHRFKLSNMMPNAWFYKLRDMSKPKPQNTRKLPQRKSYYHSTESSLIRNHDSSTTLDPQLPCAEPHRKSSKTRAKRKTIYMPSPKQVTPDCIFHDPDENDSNIHLDFQARPDEDIFIDGSEFDSFDEGTSDHHLPIISKGMLRSKFGPSAADDIIIDVNAFAEKLDMASEPGPDMPTKKNNYRPSWSPGRARPGPKKKGVAARKSVSRVKIHGNRLGRRMTAGSKKMESDDDRKIGRKGWLVESESCAVVKASVDPERDFRESMVEMIVENNIRASKDLEELLACYLSLNSNQYHGLIIKAFEQIWFNMPQTHF